MYNIEVKELEYCKLEVLFKTDKELIAQKTDEIANEIQKDVKMPGFRQGKATTDLIKIRMKKQIHNLVAERLANEAFQFAIDEKNIKPFSKPHYTKVELNANEFECIFNVLVKPTFEIKEYKELEIPKFPEPFKTEEFAQKILQEVRVKYGDTNPFEESDLTNEGDTLIINCHCVNEDTKEEVSAFNLQGQVITLGKTNIPADFDKQLVGMKIGEKRIFTLNFPELPNLDFSNKRFTFEVEILMGSKNTPAALDDALALKLGLKTFDELSTYSNGVADTRLKELEKDYYLNQLSSRLVSMYDFEVPQWIVLTEAQFQAKQLQKEWKELTDEEREAFVIQARASVKLALILDATRAKEPDSQLSDQECFEIITKNFSPYVENQEQLNKIFEEASQNGQLAMLVGKVRDDNVLEFMLKNIKIVE